MVMLLAETLLNKPILNTMDAQPLDRQYTEMFRTFVRGGRRVEATEFVAALDASATGVQKIAELFERLPPVAFSLWVEWNSPRGGKVGVLGVHGDTPDHAFDHSTARKATSYWRLYQFVGDRRGISLFAIRGEVALDEHFLMIGDPRMSFPEAYGERHKAMFIGAFVRFLQIVEMLDCINIDTKYVDPIQPRKKTSRRVTIPDREQASYETLVVRQLGQRTRSAPGEPTGTRPRSAVRGNTAHYGNCCPGAHEPRGKLFGRLEGRVWRNPHWAGNADNGTVVSELTIDPTGLLR